MTGADPVPGDRLGLDAGPVAHGGSCVARAPDGRVVFVRHALPGERVEAVVTEVRSGYLRADTVAVHSPSADRVAPPCRYAGRCGGCDFQHATPAAQRDLKATVLAEQLVRLGGLAREEVAALEVRVEPLPGGPLGWRSRMRYAVDAAGRAGLLGYRSHEVIPVDRCPIAHPALQRLALTAARWPDDDWLEAVASSTGDLAVTGSASGAVTGPRWVTERAAGRAFHLPAAAFWQVHPAAPDALAHAVRDLLDPRPGERAWDLYGGAGLFTAALADRAGAVTLVESDPAALAGARASLAGLDQVRIVRSRVERFRPADRPDLVVLDPPRAGAGRAVVEMIAAAGPRRVGYVACDPAAFARDVATFRALGWRLAALRCFDAFPMTHHVECVAALEPAARAGRGPG